jgi:hypothetical protein
VAAGTTARVTTAGTAPAVVAAMTESRGRVARWSAAALAAPVAAGLFAGTTAWASGHDPLHPDGSATPQVPAPAPTEDAQMAALRAQLAAQSATLKKLTSQVAAVKAQAAAMAGHGGRTGGSSGGSSSTSRSGGSSGSHGSGGSSSSHTTSGGTSSSGGGSVTKPAPAPAPKPPPTQGGTGASGAPK